MDTSLVPTTSRPIGKPLYWRLHLIILVIGLVAVLSGVFALRYLETRMIGTAGEGLALAASDIADKLDLVLFERYADVQVIAKIAQLHLYNRQVLTDYLNTVQQSYPGTLWIAVTDAAGTIIASSKPASVGRDRHEQSWFQAVRGGTIYIGDVALSPDSGHLQSVLFAAPVTDAQGRFVGAVIVHVGLSVLEDAAVRTSRAFQGREGFDDRLEYALLKSSGELFIDSFSQNVDSSNLKHLGLPSAHLLLSGTPGYVMEMHARRHVSVLTGYAQTEGYGRFPGLNWGVLIRRDARDVLAPIRTVQEVLALVGALVFVPLLGGLFWSSHRLRREWTQAQAHRARAEEAEQKIRNILEHSTQLFYSHTSDHVLTYLSPQARAYLGCDLGATPINCTEFLTKNPVNQQGIERTQRAIDTGQAQPPYELELKTKDGRLMWVEVHEAPVVRDGKTVAVVGSLTDITNRKRLEEQRGRLLSILEGTTDFVAMADADGRVLYVNRAGRKMVGFDEAEDLSSRWIADKDEPQGPADFLQEGLFSAFREGAWSGETTLRTRDGREIPVSQVILAHRGSDGVVQFFSIIARDIRERKQVQDALRRSEEWFRSLLENATDLIAAFEADGTIRYASPSHRALGYTPADLLGTNVYSLIHSDDRSKVSAAVTQALLSPGVPQFVEARVRKADGQWLLVDTAGQVTSDVAGRMLVVVNARDITERRRLEMSARRAEHMAMLGLLLGGIAHELKNPLFVLTGSVQLLQEQWAAKAYTDLGAGLNRVASAGKTLEQTVQRFMTLARPAPPARERCWVQNILQQMLDFLHHEFLMNGIRVETAMSPDLPSIESDPRLLQDAFLNLLMNAVQAMRDAHGKGTLTVSAQLAPPPSGEAGKGSGDWIEVRIRDDGPGIPSEHQAKLFEPFFTTKPPGVGTGLGLWTVRTNLASLGGTVTCETEVGQGATFIIRLPVAGLPTS